MDSRPFSSMTVSHVPLLSSSSSTGSGKSSSSSAAHAHAMAELGGFSKTLSSICSKHVAGEESIDDTDKKRRRLMDAKKNHMETITFLRPMINDSAENKKQYEDALKAFKVVVDEINKLDDQVLGISQNNATNNN